MQNFVGSVLITICLFQHTWTAPSSKLTTLIQNELKTANYVDIIVSIHGSTSSVLQQLKQQKFQTRADRLNAVTATLQQYSASSQKPILEFLANHHDPAYVKSLWVSNQIIIKGAEAKLISQLASMEQISEINLDERIELDKPLELHPFAKPKGTATPEWGIVNVQAPEAWALENGNAGNGILIANVDTGVRFTHESLFENYIGEYGWYDPYLKSAEPNDQHGHGTHTIGSIAGKGGIGVAHEAKWMACKGCNSASCAMSALLECGQFILCPTRPNGTDQDCSRAPHVVSNSWGSIRGSLFYNEVIEAYHIAEIIPVFSIGNNGPSCSTASSPGDHYVIGVGATTSLNELAYFSSIGPSSYGDIKPNVVAPGLNINSAYHMADDAYYSVSGTSMAAPHVAGVVALLKSAKPDLTYDYVLFYLYGGADTTSLVSTYQTCVYIRDDVFPNYSFGFGKINALNSLKLLLQDIRQNEN